MAKKRKIKKGDSHANGELDEKSKKFIYLLGGIFIVLVLLFIGLEISQG